MPPLLDFGSHIIPQKQFSFCATQVQPRNDFGALQTNPLGFGTHVVPQCPLPWCKYKYELLWVQKALEHSFTDDLPFPDDLPAYTPAQTINEIRKDLMIYASYYCQSTFFLDRHLMCITSIT